MIYFEDRKRKTQNKEKYKILFTIFETIDVFVIIATIVTSAKFFVTGFGTILISISTGITRLTQNIIDLNGILLSKHWKSKFERGQKNFQLFR